MMDEHPKIFKINDYITLKHENDRTNIYVKGRFFNQCKYLLINIVTYPLTFREPAF